MPRPNSIDYTYYPDEELFLRGLIEAGISFSPPTPSPPSPPLRGAGRSGGLRSVHVVRAPGEVNPNRVRVGRKSDELTRLDLRPRVDNGAISGHGRRMSDSFFFF